MMQGSKSQDTKAKVYVSVVVRHELDGRVVPLSFVWEDGHTYEIDAVQDVCRAASTKAGGAGMRYTVSVLGKQTFLFYDNYEEKWFMERKR